MKKTLSVLLTIAMLLSLSVCAFATEGEGDIQPVEQAEAPNVIVDAPSDSAGATPTVATLGAAIEKVTNGDVIDGTIAVKGDGETDVGGLKVGGTSANLTIQVEGEVVISDPTVGSSGTETQGFQLLQTKEDAEDGVVIKGEGEGATIVFDGIFEEGDEGNETMKRAIQNYTDLTLENVTIDGTDLSNYKKVNGTQTFDENNENIVISVNAGSLTVGENASILSGEDTVNDAALIVYANGAGYKDDAPTVTITGEAGTIQGAIIFDGKGVEEYKKTGEAPELNIEGGTFKDFVLKVTEAVADYIKNIQISGGNFDQKTVEVATKKADGSDYVFEDFLAAQHVVVKQDDGTFKVMTQAEADALNKKDDVVAVIPFTPAEYNYYTGTTTGTVAATAGNADVVVNGETVTVALNDTVVSARVAPVALADNAPAEIKVVVSHSALSGNVFTAIDMVQNLADTLIVKDVEGVHLDAEDYEIVFDGYDVITLKLTPELLAELGAGSHVFTIVLGGGYEIQVTVVVA